MKRIYATALLTAVGSLLIGCALVKNRVCKFQKQTVSQLSVYVASELQCTNVVQIEKDIADRINGLNDCSGVAETGPIADVVCPIASKAIASLIIDAPIPDAWGCKATSLKDSVALKIEGVCKLIPVKDE